MDPSALPLAGVLVNQAPLAGYGLARAGSFVEVLDRVCPVDASNVMHGGVDVMRMVCWLVDCHTG